MNVVPFHSSIYELALQKTFQTIFKENLDLKTSEKCLILADYTHHDLAFNLYQASQKFSSQSNLVIMPTMSKCNVDPPKYIGNHLKDADVGLILTHHSLSHTQTRRRACKSGTRIVSLPRIQSECLKRAINGKSIEMINRTRKLSDILTIGHEVNIFTDIGTDLTFSICKKKGKMDTGIVHEPGKFSNLPAGESCIGPVEGTAQGKMMVDGSFPYLGLLDEPVQFTIKEGYVSRISGNHQANNIRKLLRPYGHEGRCIAELGIGTNPNAQLTGCTVEDEKMLGTLHIALGNNISFGGSNNVRCHFDCVIKNPTVIIDGQLLIEKGKHLI